MRKLSLTLTIAMCLLLATSLAFATGNTNNAEPTTTLPKTCTYPAGTYGGIVRDHNAGYWTIQTANIITIKVTGEMTVPAYDADGNKFDEKVYLFDASVDKPTIVCPTHGSHPWDDISGEFSETEIQNFFFPQDEGECK